MLKRLLKQSHGMEPQRLVGHYVDAVRDLGAEDGSVFVVDLQQRELVEVRPDGSTGPTTLPVDTTLAGRAFMTSEVHSARIEDQVQLWVPVIDGADRLGMLRVDLAAESFDDALVERFVTLGSLLAEMLVARAQYTDAFGRAARRRPTTLAADMQWALLPPLTLRTPRVALSGMLEPAYDIGGDAFDYALNDDTLHLAVFDSMGHGLPATWAATIAVGSTRNSRRHDLSAAQAYVAADAALRAEFDDLRFVTAHLATLALDTGTFRWVNAGHPAPLLIRGHTVHDTLNCAPSWPLGLGGEVVDQGEVVLQRGDRILFFTDGVTEARRPSGEAFGTTRLIDTVERTAMAGLGPAETMRRLSHEILDHHAHELDDDFTIVLVEYTGGGPEEPGLG
ncbi:MAG: serine/threonine-protein phosphatase [Actinobacteria bacterium]|nr:serine/threonine-protein phosphatase [Actinomycetota bacterium]